MPGQRIIPRVCRACGTPFLARMQNVQRGHGAYCSAPCRDAANRLPNPVAAFWARVVKTATCWLWTGALDSDGYGKLVRDHRQWYAHRYAYIVSGLSIPDGLTLDHLCRVRHCVNPDHLEPVTSIENLRRGHGRAARNRRATECQYGHPFDNANTYVSKRGHRHCRACRNRRAAALRERRRAK